MAETSKLELHTWLIEMLGKDEKESLCKQFFEEYKATSDVKVGHIRNCQFKELGFSIDFGISAPFNDEIPPEQLICTNVHLYFDVTYFPVGCANFKYSNFSGKLPFGLSTDDNDDAIQRKLGEPGWRVEDYGTVMPGVIGHCYYLSPIILTAFLCKETANLVGLHLHHSDEDPWSQPENPDTSSCIRFPGERIRNKDG